MFIANFFKLSYWFSLQPSIMQKSSFWISAGIFFAALLVATVLKIIASRWRKNSPLSRFLRRLASPFIFLGVVGFIFLFLKTEMIYLLGARFWFIFIGAGFFVWVILLVIKFLKTYKKEMEQIAKEREFKKYLP